MTVLITLTTAGTNTGPFNLYSNIDGYISPFETGVSKAALLAGYSSALVPDYTSTIRIKSNGTCQNYIDIPVAGVPTTTTSSTTSTTLFPPSIQLYVYAKYNGEAPPPGNLQYTVNAGSPVTIGPLSSTDCLYVYTITGIFAGDGIDFTNSLTYKIAGSFSGCPATAVSGSCNYGYIVTSSLAQYVYLTIDGDNAC